MRKKRNRFIQLSVKSHQTGTLESKITPAIKETGAALSMENRSKECFAIIPQDHFPEKKAYTDLAPDIAPVRNYLNCFGYRCRNTLGMTASGVIYTHRSNTL